MPTNQVRKEQRHQKILDAALTVFSRHGYHAAAVDEIAQEARTSKGGVYFHFPGKHSIFLALLDHAADALLARIAVRMQAEQDPIAKVDVALQALLQTFAAQRPLARLLLLETAGAGPEFYTRMTQVHGRFIAFLKDNLDEAVARQVIPPLDTDTASLVWFGALNQVVTHWILSDNFDDLEDSYPALRTMLLRGVGFSEVGRGQTPSP